MRCKTDSGNFETDDTEQLDRIERKLDLILRRLKPKSRRVKPTPAKR